VGGEAVLAGLSRLWRRAALTGGAAVAARTAGGRGHGSCWRRGAVSSRSIGSEACTRWCLAAAAA